MASSFLFFVFCAGVIFRWSLKTAHLHMKKKGRMKVSLEAVVVDNADYLKEVELVEKL